MLIHRERPQAFSHTHPVDQSFTFLRGVPRACCAMRGYYETRKYCVVLFPRSLAFPFLEVMRARGREINFVQWTDAAR